MVKNEGALSSVQSLELDETPDFTVDDLTLLKEILLSLEKTVDEIQLGQGSETKSGGYIFQILEQANVSLCIRLYLEIYSLLEIFTHFFDSKQINVGNADIIIKLLDTLVQYLATAAEASHTAFRRGAGLQHMLEFLTIVFVGSAEDLRARVNRCYKVYIEPEPQKQTRGVQKQENGWFQTKATMPGKLRAKTISYWCFSPGFG